MSSDAEGAQKMSINLKFFIAGVIASSFVHFIWQVLRP